MRLFWTVFAFCLLSHNAQAFDRQAWQIPQIEENGSTITITVANQPSGLFFTWKLDNAIRYRLTVDGSGGPFTMRLTRDGGPPQYLAAPTSQTSLTIEGTPDLELLFYADKAARYTLSRITLEPCPDCKIAEDVKARIRADIPDIDELEPLKKAERLLHWAANVSDYSTNPNLTPNDFESWPVEKALFDFFDKDIGGVSCGGMSVFAKNVFHLFGLDAVTVNYGAFGTNVTHVSVVLHESGEFYLFDPTFASTYQRDNTLVSLREALVAIRSKEEISFRARELGLRRRDLIDLGPILEPLLCAENHTMPSGASHCRMGSYRYLDILRVTLGDEWRASGVELDEFALLKLFYKGMFSIGDGLKSETRGQLMALLKDIGVPFHQ